MPLWLQKPVLNFLSELFVNSMRYFWHTLYEMKWKQHAHLPTCPNVIHKLVINNADIIFSTKFEIQNGWIILCRRCFGSFSWTIRVAMACCHIAVWTNEQICCIESYFKYNNWVFQIHTTLEITKIKEEKKRTNSSKQKLL